MVDLESGRRRHNRALLRVLPSLADNQGQEEEKEEACPTISSSPSPFPSNNNHNHIPPKSDGCNRRVVGGGGAVGHGVGFQESRSPSSCIDDEHDHPSSDSWESYDDDEEERPGAYPVQGPNSRRWKTAAG